MGEINLSRSEIEALKATDDDVLNKLIDQCLYEERVYPLRDLHLENCGEFVASRLRAYEKALSEYGKAKASRKRSETEQRARRAGSNLANSVQQMKHRAETEERERQLFFVDDHVIPPSHFSEHLTVQVSYRWREAVEDEWLYGNITFTHDVDTKPDYSELQPRRKPSATQLKLDRQDKLYRDWEHLMKMSLYSVKEYLRSGGKGGAIPKSFKASPDSYSKELNNHSTKFWL